MKLIYKCIFLIIQKTLLILIDKIIPFLQRIAITLGVKAGEIVYTSDSLEFCTEDNLPLEITE